MSKAVSEERKFPATSSIYLLRTTQQHHVQLSMMADQKASFLLAASFVVLSILAGYLADGKTSIIMLFVAAILLLASIFAILAIMPRHNYSKPQNVKNNILFFGNFAQISLDDFTEHLYECMSSDESVYKTMIHDIYAMGKVLNDRKYRFLAISYKIFFIGLLLCPLVAAIEYFYYPDLF